VYVLAVFKSDELNEIDAVCPLAVPEAVHPLKLNVASIVSLVLYEDDVCFHPPLVHIHVHRSYQLKCNHIQLSYALDVLGVSQITAHALLPLDDLERAYQVIFNRLVKLDKSIL
jgi:hypothetical protein